MSTTVYVKQHDDKAIFTDTLTVGGNPVNLDGTVKFLLRKPGLSISQSATIVAAGAGTVKYQPTSADTAVVGKYRQEWEATFADGKKLTFPNDGYNIVMIEQDIG